ncbi:MAG: hypothetical protein INH37_22475 [Myxococcaceae bacterium]|jgi:hypothetical protein|nr:hypothetical protein [Myxococcaceae bacterium]
MGTDSRKASRVILWVAGVLGALLLANACFPVLVGAPCESDENCPRTQFCSAAKVCENGERSTRPDAGDADAGVNPTDAGVRPDAGVADAGLDGGVGEGPMNDSCFDGIDNDGDQAIDCADSDCEAVLCRANAGGCDVLEGNRSGGRASISRAHPGDQFPH